MLLLTTTVDMEKRERKFKLKGLSAQLPTYKVTLDPMCKTVTNNVEDGLYVEINTLGDEVSMCISLEALDKLMDELVIARSVIIAGKKTNAILQLCIDKVKALPEDDVVNIEVYGNASDYEDFTKLCTISATVDPFLMRLGLTGNIDIDGSRLRDLFGHDNIVYGSKLTELGNKYMAKKMKDAQDAINKRIGKK